MPSASYQTAIDRISALGTRTAIHQESSDVTEQVVDVESRITTQRASVQRVRALLAKATTIGEIVSVETELTRREADLESLLAKQKNLSLQTELATLALTVSEKGKTPEPPKEDDRGFLAGLRGGWDAFTATFSRGRDSGRRDAAVPDRHRPDRDSDLAIPRPACAVRRPWQRRRRRTRLSPEASAADEAGGEVAVGLGAGRAR